MTDHSRAPVLDALAAYHRRGEYPFTPPGHKQGRGADPRVREVLGEGVFTSDLLATSGLDDRTSSGHVLEEAQELMADAVHAEHAFFSTCGSSLSVKSAMLSVAGPHEKLLVGRDAHKSVVSGLILSGIEPIWVEPRWDAEQHFANPPGPDAYAAAFAEHPDARGAMVTSPTPYGASAELSAIAEVCHRHGRPLLVDEAWGAHLPFHADLPSWAMDAGGDVCVTSVHKMGTGLEQGSVFHLQGDLVAPEVLMQRADLLGTTSPNVLLYAAMDGWRRQMVEQGERLIDKALGLAARARERISRLDGLRVLGEAELAGPGRGAARFDPLPTVIDVSALGTTGYRCADWLREHEHIDMHLVDHRRISAQFSVADDEDSLGRLLTALEHLVRAAPGLPAGPRVEVPDPASLRMEQVILPRDAFFGRVEEVPAEEAVGRVTAEMLTPYPPGIPAALPGERLTEPVVRYLRSGKQAGMAVPDAADPTLEKFRVVVEEAHAD